MSACPAHPGAECECWSSAEFPAQAIARLVASMYGADEWDVRLAVLEAAKANGYTPRQANLCAQHALMLVRRDAWYADVGMENDSTH